MKNKLSLSLFALMAMAFTSCQKDDNQLTPSITDNSVNRSSSSGGGAQIGPVPSSFTQKLLIENFTGAAYGKCPDNDYMITQIQNQYPNRVIAAAFHTGDAMQTNATSDLLNFVSNGTMPQIPAVMLNRIVFNSKMMNTQSTWTNDVAYALSGTAYCGLALQSSVRSNMLSMTIHAGFNTTLAGTYKMCVYVVENNVRGTGSGYDQVNGSNTTIGSYYYNAGTPLINYVHNNTMRQMVTAVNGITVPASCLVNGGHMIQNFAIDLRPGTNINDTYIIGFVYNTANLEVINAQVAKAGALKNWD